MLITVNNWNTIVKSWNQHFWTNAESFKKTKQQWIAFKKSSNNTTTLANFVENYLNEPSSFHLPQINNQHERKQWVEVLKNYKLIQNLFHQFENWAVEFKKAHPNEFLDTEKVLPGLIISSNALARMKTFEKESYDAIVAVLTAKDQNRVSWPITWAKFFTEKKQPADFRDALFLNSAKNNFLETIPALESFLEDGLLCFEQAGKKSTVSLMENYQEVAANLSKMSKSESMLEIIDLRSKLLGIKNYCNLEADGKINTQYQVGMKTLDTLEQILITPNHFEVLQTLLQALQTENFDLDDLLHFCSDEHMNIFFTAWLKTLSNEDLVEFFVNTLGSFEDQNFQKLMKVLISKEMHQLLKLMSQRQEVLNQGWKFTLDFTNFYLKLESEDSSIASFIEFLFPQEVLVDLVTRSNEFDLSVLEQTLLADENASKELVQFVQDGTWIQLFDLLFSTKEKLTKVVDGNQADSLATPKHYPVISVVNAENTLIQNCFWELHYSRPLTLKEMVENFPVACESVRLRQN